MWKYLLACLLAVGLVSSAQNTEKQSATTDSTAGLKAYELLKIPGLKNRVSISKPIVVAIVDDGFRLTHKALAKYFYLNEKEIPGNGIDDDGNGYIDDTEGYDVSDHDNDVSILHGEEMDYYHGTMLAGIIVREAEMAFGPEAWRYVKILPVKALPDKAGKMYVLDGYEGIAYAVKQHADIILCAWSGGVFDNKYAPIFAEAQAKNILILGSAGNAYAYRVDPPASLPSVCAVAAIDSNLRKIYESNYGKKVDLSASGDIVYAPHPIKDNAYSFIDGTSSAVALVAGAATILKVMKPDATPLEIVSALKYTATPIDSFNQSYTGKLGAGVPNVTDAVNFLLNSNGRDAYFNPNRPKGEIVIDKSTLRNQWTVRPFGGIKGLQVYFIGKPKNPGKGNIDIYGGDSLILSAQVKDFPRSIYIAGPSMKLAYDGKKGKEPLVFDYGVDPIDSSTLYCTGTTEINDTAGIITDGSSQMNYANNCDCKWLITVPEGKHIKLTFDQFDTEAKVDFVWLFDGKTTQPEYQLAQFSGPDLPPVIISHYNQVLVWFTTNAQNTARGWQLHYQAVDDSPGILLPIDKQHN